MSTTSHFPVDPTWGTSLDFYLESRRDLPIRKYSAYEVQSAIESLVPNNSVDVSDSTLEAVILVIHYPALLETLVNKDTLVICSYILIQYFNQHPVSHCPLYSRAHRNLG